MDKKMCSSLNTSLIDNFRNRINENPTAMIGKYGCVEGKAHWSVICSVMDWITVAVGGIDCDKKNFKPTGGLDNSRKMILLISSIDILLESITQLHRVFINKDTVPFKGDNSIFLNKLIHVEDDNAYFKEIRAIFSAHPVNLKIGSRKESYCASWSGNMGFGGDFSVILSKIDLSNNIDSKFFWISLDELFKFAKTRYEYLNEILKHIPKGRGFYNYVSP
ncbi:MAG: hypothetical protein FWF34_00565 [Alphaproteobacteria bacterium]|nr:hypothetical protein [Alphaproteobacteria bacterium]MCL2889740.1 hypothetical protein [Alphaproteobacteria bacterium]